MTVFYKKAIKWGWRLLAVLIILIALAMGMSRMLTPYFNRHLPDFEAYATQTLQTPVTIEHVFLSWSVYEPELVFDQVQIIDKTTHKPTISIREIKLNFSLFRSLWAWQPMLEKLKISGVHFTVHEQARGTFNVAGFGISVSDSLTGASLKVNEILAWIFSQPKLSLHDIDISYITSQGLKQPVILRNLILEDSGETHSIYGQAIFQQEAPTTVVLNIKWHGKVDDLSHASAMIDLYLEGISLPERFSQLSWHDWQVKQGVGSAQIWAEWKESALQSIQSKFQIYDLNLFSKTTHQSRAVPRLSGNVHWRREGANQIITGQDILIDFPQHLWPTIDFSVMLAPNKANQLAVKTVQTNYLNLSDVIDWLLISGFSSENFNSIIKNIHLQGNVKNLTINLPIDTEVSLRNSIISAELNNISFDSWNTYPVIKNLAGKLDWDGKRGRLQLNSPGIFLTYPHLFQNSLQFDQALGQFTLSNKQQDVWILSATQLQLSNQDVITQSNFDINFNSGTLPIINLTSHFSVAHAEHIIHYLPMNLLGAKLTKWLKQAFHGGQIGGGKVVLQGNLKDFPFDQKHGKFLITGNVKNFEFNFAPEWPMIHKLHGAFTFLKKTITMDTDSGFIHDIPLKQVHATMTNVGVPEPTVLIIQGLIQSDLAKGLYFIHHSPLEKKMGADLSEISLSGPMQLNLGLTIPIAKPDNTHVKGMAAISGATLSVPEWNLTLDKMTGTYQFTENGIDAKDLQGRLLGENVKLSFATQSSAKQKFVHAILHSQVTIAALEKWLDIPLSKVLTGSTAYQVELDLAHHNNSSPTQMTLRSYLQGMAVNVPSVYAKSANSVRDFKLTMLLKPGQPLQSKIYYGNLLTAAITIDRVNQKMQFLGGAIRLGKGDVSWPKTSGLSIVGYIDQFDWDTWKKYFDSLTTDKIKEAKPTINWWRSVDVLVNKLIIMGQQLNQARVQLSQLNNALQIGLTTHDMQGQIILPTKDLDSVIQAKFQHLYFSSALENHLSQWNPKNIPAISFVGDDVRVGDKKLGRLAFNTSPSTLGLTIDNLSISSSVVKLTAKGDWKLFGNTYKTHLQGNIETDHVSNLLTDWGFPEPNLVGNKGSVQFNLNWLEAPYSASLAMMSGNVTIKLGEGQIVNLSGANAAKLGFGRILNILSLQTLPRRLSLNFSDLTQKGYSFDYMTANFSLTSGNAYTKNMVVNGPVARVEVSGRLGLKAKDYDLTVNVTPYVTGSLPMVATIATGFNPVAGAATWLVEKIVSQGVSNVTTYRYKVTGPWDNPVWVQK